MHISDSSKTGKAFIVKAVCALFIYLLLWCTYNYSYYHTGEYQNEVNGSEIYLSIRKSKAVVDNVTKLIVGDSVAKQLYDNEKYNGKTYSLACNYAISMAGQYILIKNFIEANKPDKLQIIVVMTPASFHNNLNNRFTYQYFIKPFYTHENIPYFTGTVLNQIRNNPFHRISQLPFVKTSNWTPSVMYGNEIADKYKISIEYLLKIKAIADANSYGLKIVSPVIAESRRSENHQEFRAVIRKYGLDDVFSDYFESIRYLPDDSFKDGVHYKNAGELGADPLDILRQEK